MVRIDNVLRMLLITGVFAVVLLTPFINIDSWFFPYITGKSVFFRVVVELILGGWLILVVMNPRFRPPYWSPILISFVVFTAVMGLANLLGVDPVNSFWSNFERMEGYITILHLLALLVVAMSVFQTEYIWNTLLKSSVAVSVAVCLTALLELGGEDAPNRLSEPLGNPIYLGGYLLFNIFLALMFLLRHLRARTYEWLAVYGAIILLQTLVLIQTGTRGSMLALAGGVFLVAVVMAWDKYGEKWVRRSAAAVAVAIVLVGGFLGAVVLSNNWPAEEPPEAMSSFHQTASEWPVVERFAGISLEEGGEGARLLLWGMAWEAFSDRPLLGWGQENFSYIFAEYYEPDLYDREPWFDRSHNMALEWLAAGGIIGFIAYLAVFVMALVLLWRISAARLSIYDKAAITALLAAYFTHNLFVFDFLLSYILFTVVLGFIAVQSALDRDPQVYRSSGSVISNAHIKAAVAAPVVLVVVAYGVYEINVIPGRVAGGIIEAQTVQYCARDAGGAVEEERELNELVRVLNQSDLCRDYLSEELRQIPPEQDVQGMDIVDDLLLSSIDIFDQVSAGRSHLGWQEATERYVISAQRAAAVSSASPEVRGEYLQRAKEAQKKIIERFPERNRPYVLLGRLHSTLDDQERALESHLRARELAPSRQLHLLDIAQVYLDKNEPEEAVEWMKKAHELESSFEDIKLNYAAVALAAGQYEAAGDLLEEIPEEEYIFDNNFLSPLERQGQYRQAAEVRQRRLELLADEYQILRGQPDEEVQRLLSQVMEEYQALLSTYRDVLEEEQKADQLQGWLEDNFPEFDHISQPEGAE